MRKLINLLILAGLIWAAVYVIGRIRLQDDGKVEVYYGSKTICTECGRTIDNNVHSLRVEKSKIGNYKVEVKKGLCPSCAPAGVAPF